MDRREASMPGGGGSPVPGDALARHRGPAGEVSHPVLSTALLALVGVVVFAACRLVRARVDLDGEETDPWSSTLAYVATAYGVIVGFSILLLFAEFADARRAVGDEATSIGTAYDQAGLFPDAGPGIRQALLCYADAVVEEDWPAMRHGRGAPEVDAAFAALVASLGEGDAPPEGALHAATATNLAAQVGGISTARQTRLVAAETSVPALLWGLLVGGGLFICVLMFVVTASARPRTQGALVASVAVFTVAMVLLVHTLSTPFAPGAGRVSPRLIEEAVAQMQAGTDPADISSCER